MGVVALCSASGSPGVTTTAVAMALNWPRPVVLVEADPSGGAGVLAGFLRGTTGYETGLKEIALSPLGVSEALRDVVRPLTPGVSFVAGVLTHHQAGALHDLWAPLSAALADLDSTGQDVIVDAGRLGLLHCPHPLLAEADLTLLFTRATLPAIVAARSWAEHARDPSIGWRHPGVLLLGEGQPYRATEVTKVLGLPVLTGLPEDPAAATVYHRGATAPKRFETGPYMRALRAAVACVQSEITRDPLAPEKTLEQTSAATVTPEAPS